MSGRASVHTHAQNVFAVSLLRGAVLECPARSADVGSRPSDSIHLYKVNKGTTRFKPQQEHEEHGWLPAMSRHCSGIGFGDMEMHHSY